MRHCRTKSDFPLSGIARPSIDLGWRRGLARVYIHHLLSLSLPIRPQKTILAHLSPCSPYGSENTASPIWSLLGTLVSTAALAAAVAIWDAT